MTSARTLPIRVAPIEGEAIDSWLEAIAERTQTAFGDLLPAVGLPARKPSGDCSWVLRLTDRERETLGNATGMDPATLESMTLSTYFDRAIYVDTPLEVLGRGFLWGRGTGSRFCPLCLAETNGRWQLKWRLRWTFACTIHDCLLVDACGECGVVQRKRPHIGEFVPQPKLCAGPAPNARNHERCLSDLTAIQPLNLGEQHPAIRAQKIVEDVIAAETATFGVYETHPQPRMKALADIRAIAGRALRYGTPEELAERVPSDVLREYDALLTQARATKHGLQTPGLRIPARGATAAVGVVAALRALDRPTISAATEELRWLVGASRERGHVIRATNLGWGRQSSPTLVGIQLNALGPYLKPSDQLRYGISSLLPTVPDPASSAEALAKALPTALWPAWSLRFVIANCDQRQVRLGLSAAILLVRRRIALSQCLELLNSPISGGALSRILRLLQHLENWSEVRLALTKMASYLEMNKPPIDYQRRRSLDYSTLLPDEVWAQICRSLGAPGAQRIRALAARCFLFERLSGVPADLAPFADDTTHFRRAVANFAGSLTVELATALDDHAGEFLETQGVHGEPTTWQPPTGLLKGMKLPGFDPAASDALPVGDIAVGSDRIRKISIKHQVDVDVARYLAEVTPARPPGWIDGEAVRPAHIGAYRAAKNALPPELLAELYCVRRISVADIASAVGVSRHVLARLAKDYGIELAPPGPKVKFVFERDWLFDQYVQRQRSLPEIAAEVGVSITSVARWAKTFGIPLRRRGGGSHTAVRTARQTAEHAPELLKPVLATPGGWERLQTFAKAAAYPTLGSAAEHLAMTQSVLTLKVRRIEAELGMKLLERAVRGRPMAVTVDGARVIAALRAWKDAV